MVSKHLALYTRAYQVPDPESSLVDSTRLPNPRMKPTAPIGARYIGGQIALMVVSYSKRSLQIRRGG
jgi:hypothetical protein